MIPWLYVITYIQFFNFLLARLNRLYGYISYSFVVNSICSNISSNLGWRVSCIYILETNIKFIEFSQNCALFEYYGMPLLEAWPNELKIFTRSEK